jgi:hypothetical protein
MVDPIGGQKRVSGMDCAFVRSKIDGPAAQFLLEKVTKKHPFIFGGLSNTNTCHAATPTHPAAAADLLILGRLDRRNRATKVGTRLQPILESDGHDLDAHLICKHFGLHHN